MNKMIQIFFLWLLMLSNGFANGLIDLEANSALIDNKKGISVYTGNAIVTQGSLTVGAQKITVFSTQKQVEKMIAKGRAYYQQKSSQHHEKIDASADQIVFLPQQQLVHLMGNVELTRGTEVMTGDTLDYDIANDKILFNQSKKNSGKVKFKLKL